MNICNGKIINAIIFCEACIVATDAVFVVEHILRANACCKAAIIVSVSYTHLDVYKRQKQIIAAKAQWSLSHELWIKLTNRASGKVPRIGKF